MELRTLKAHLKRIDDCFLSDRPRVDEVVSGDLSGKVENIRVVEDTLVRLRKCRTASDVFREFSVDAAKAKVEEALYGKTSQARQRAQETILDMALGKAIQRSMSMTLKVSDMGEKELTHEIRTLMGELGFAGRDGASSRLLIGTQGREGQVEVIEVRATSGGTGELHQVVETNPPDTGGEQIRQDKNWSI